MVRREMADRIGGAGVAGEREGLAAAAAEIDVAALAALARLRQEARAPEGIEGGVMFPDLAQRMVFHRPEFEARDRLGGMARQHAAGRGHVERAAAPSADARLGEAGVIVGHNGVDDDAAMMLFAQRLDTADGLLDLLA